MLAVMVACVKKCELMSSVMEDAVKMSVTVDASVNAAIV